MQKYIQNQYNIGNKVEDMLIYLETFLGESAKVFWEQWIPVQGNESGKNSKIQNANSKSRVTIHDTIQIHGTIQNTRYYSNSKYEQCKSTHQGVDQAPKFITIQGTTMLIWWVEH